MTRESTVLADIRLEFGARDDVMLIRINTGVFRAMHRDDHVIRSAPNGTPDLLGVLATGRALAIETKRTRGGRQSEAQRDFQTAWEARGGLYILARSVDDVYEHTGLSRQS